MKRVHSCKGRPTGALPTPANPRGRRGPANNSRKARSPGHVLPLEQYSSTEARRFRNGSGKPRPETMGLGNQRRGRETRRVELCRQLWEANCESSSNSAGSSDSLSSVAISDDSSAEEQETESLPDNRTVTMNTAQIHTVPEEEEEEEMEVCDMETEQQVSGSGDSTPITGDMSPRAVGRKLDKQLVQLQNLVASLENLEMELSAKHDEEGNEIRPQTTTNEKSTGGGCLSKCEGSRDIGDRRREKKEAADCNRGRRMESSSDGGGGGGACGGAIGACSKIPTPSSSSSSLKPPTSHPGRDKTLMIDEVPMKKAKGRPLVGKENLGGGGVAKVSRASSPMPVGHTRTPTPHPGGDPPSRGTTRDGATGMDELMEGGNDPSNNKPGSNPHKRIRGIWCEHCNSRLVELKRQAVKLWMPFAMHRANIPAYKEAELLTRISDKLQVPDKLRKHVFHDVCDVCQTRMQYLKGEALNMVQSLERTQSELSHRQVVKMGTPRNVVQLPRTTPHYSPAVHQRLHRQTPKLGISRHHGAPQRGGLVQGGGHQGLSRIPSPYSWAYQHKTHSQMIASGQAGVVPSRGGMVPTQEQQMMSSRENGGAVAPPSPVPGMQSNGAVRPKMLPLPQHYKPAPPPQLQLQQPPTAPNPPGLPLQQQQPAQAGPFSPVSTSSTGSGASAAASFFARAAQKLNISSRKKKRHHHQEPEPPPFPTNFNEIIRLNPPPAPPCLTRGRLQPPGPGKVKVMLRVCPMDGNHNSVIGIDQMKKQVTVHDPLTNGYTAPSRRSGSIAPKMFAFDALFGQDESLAEMCSTSLVEIVQAVVGGSDGCLFCFGHARVGKTYSMVGMDDSSQNLGIIPCAIAWLFKLINEQKDKTGARFSVRVSAVEVTGKEEQLKDLLADVAGGQESGGGAAPGVYLREDPIVGTQLENQSELRAATADRAAYYLDAAIAARTIPDAEEDARNSHLLFTLHVYQYRVEKNNPRGSINACKTLPIPADQHVAGGRSRLHLIDLGSCSKAKDGNALSLSSLGNVILALLNGQRHLPHRESKLTQLIRESLGNMSCRTCMIAHVSPAVHAYNETLQVIQLAARVHRMKRRRNKISSSSDDSSCDEGRLRGRMRTGIRMGTLREEAIYNSSGQSSGLSSDPDFTDSSEQSCDTVIYVGRNGQALSDRELTDNEGPPNMVPIIPPQLLHLHRSSSGEDSTDATTPVAAGRDSSSSVRINQGEGATKFTRPSTPKCGASMVSKLPPKSPARTNPGVAKPGVVQLPRKIHMKGKPPMLNKEQAGEEQWIDGPSACAEKPPAEQWIDGPSCVPSAGTGQDYASHTLPNDYRQQAENNGAKPVKKETWVDGPPEFRVGGETKATLPKAQRPTKMWTGLSKPDPPPRRSLREQEPREAPPKESARPRRAIPEPTRSTAPQQPLKNPQLSKVEDADKRPVSHVSVESINSLDANQSSRPVSLHSAEEPAEEQEPMPVNSFVKDWVARHGNVPQHGDARPHRKGHARTLSEHVTMDDMAYVMKNKKSHSPDSRLICSAQSSPRLRRLRKKDYPPPPPPNSTDRTLAWVQSVQEAASSKLKHLNLQPLTDHSHPPHHSPAANTLSSRTESQTQEGSMPECDRGMLDHQVESPPPAYEHCMENTTLLEAGPAAEGQHHVPMLHVTVPSEQGSLPHSEQASIDGRSRDGGETSDQLNIPKTVTKRPKPKLDFQHLMQTNRESIYELQVDEQLEHHGGSMQKLAYGSNDDVSWNNSLPKDSTSNADNDDETIDTTVIDAHLCPLNVNADAESGIASSGGDCHLSPPTSEDSDPKSSARKIVRPSCLRRPDGASNPNLSSGDPAKPFIDSSPEDELISPGSPKFSPDKPAPISERTCDGQSPEDSTATTCPSQIDTTTSKPPVAASSSKSSAKPSVLPKPSPKKSSSPSKPAPPPRTVSKLSSPSKSVSSSGTNSGSSSPSKSSSMSPFKSSKDSKSAKEKSKSKLPSPATASKSGSKSSTLKSSAKAAKDSKSKIQSSPTKTSTSSMSRDGKLTSRSASKSPSPSKRERDTRVPRFDTGHRPSRMTDSDSGNDSGIVKNDTKLLSPYSKLTRPRISTHSSSGHGSDASSTISGLVMPTKPGLKPIKSHKLEMSSGYESMVRDSEVTCTSSSSQDSPSDTAGEKRSKSTKVLKKRAVSTSRRSRSAPARTSTDSPVSSAPQSPASHKASSPSSPLAWVDTRMFPTDHGDEPLEITMYDIEDVERMARRRKEDAEMIAVELRRQKVRELFSRQDSLKAELNDAKSLLMVDARSWSFDCLVAEHGDRDDPDYLEALEKETSILEKRVEACKSRIMIVTCFDSFNN